MHAVRHLLTPGTPGYSALRLSAVAGVFGLQFALRRRSRGSGEHPAEPAEAAAPSRRDPHPRSKKKRPRRR
jgi:hypothetical protein